MRNVEHYHHCLLPLIHRMGYQTIFQGNITHFFLQENDISIIQKQRYTLVPIHKANRTKFGRESHQIVRSCT